MVNSVTMPTAYGASGRTYNDGSVPPGNMAAGGHEENFIPALADVVAIAGHVEGRAEDLEDLVLSAMNFPETSATSDTSLSLTDSGDITFELNEPDKAFVETMDIALGSRSDTSKRMYGVVKSFNPTTRMMTATMSSKTATAGPFTDWNVFRSTAAGIPTTRNVAAGGLATGGGDLSTDRTITVTAATPAEIVAGASTSTAITPSGLAGAEEPQILTDAATTNWPISRLDAEWTVGGNRTLAAPTGMKKGKTYSLWIIQDATGSRLVTFNSCYKWGRKGTPVLSTGAGKRDLVTLKCYDDVTPAFRCTIDLDA